MSWRGWMLDSNQYQAWVSALGTREPRFSLGQYAMHHRMRNWVPAVEKFTPKTWFVRSSAQASPDMFPCHVKDGVKSANATHLPRPCLSQADVALHETELKRQRGRLDDGLVLRAHVDAWPAETRVWVMGPTIDDFYFHARGQGAPTPSVDWLHEVLTNAPPHFFDAPFTMDIARSKQPGAGYFVMDIGDAGVSDYKEGLLDTLFMASLHQRWMEALCTPMRTLTTSASSGPSMG